MRFEGIPASFSSTIRAPILIRQILIRPKLRCFMLPYCAGQPNGIPAFGTACAAANQFAVDPRIANPTGAQLLNRNLVRAIIPGTGDPLNGLALPSDPATPKGYRHTKPVDFEPRVGFAWDIFGNGKTVIRGMGGVYHMPRVGGGTGGASSLGGNPPQQRTFQILNGNIDNLTGLVDTAALYPVASPRWKCIRKHRLPTTFRSAFSGTSALRPSWKPVTSERLPVIWASGET